MRFLLSKERFMFGLSQLLTMKLVRFAESCEQLITNGLVGREDEIVILISSRRIQLDILTRELGNRGIVFDVPSRDGLTEEPQLRAVVSLLRLIQEREKNRPDYIAYRTLFGLRSGIGATSAKLLAEACVQHMQNYHQLFHTQPVPHWLTGRARNAVTDIGQLTQALSGWSLTDTLRDRMGDIAAAVTQRIFTSPNDVQAFQNIWNAVTSVLPPDMNLEELLLFLQAPSDSDRDVIMTVINDRLGVDAASTTTSTEAKHVRILTMHGAKGLHGKIVFIPAVEQGILPSFRNLQAAGLVIEHRRLFYVSITRAMAACIVSHSVLHTGPQAFALRNQPRVRLTRSQFLNEMGVPSVNRAGGLNAAEAAAIVADIDNL
jgi:superfamily I DNA/RNA helicase